MATINMHYDIKKDSFSMIERALFEHLTPKRQKISLASEMHLQEIRESLSRTFREPAILRSFEFPWNIASFFAIDLGIVQDLSDDAREVLQEERYDIPVIGGCSRDYKVSIHGKELNVGDYPLTFRLDADSSGHADNLVLVEDWKRAFERYGKDGMLDRIIEIGRKCGDSLDEHTQCLASMPRTEGDFTERQEYLRNQLYATMIKFYINMIRFYEDFFGRALRSKGYQPIKVECIGPMDTDFDVPLEIVSLANQQIPIEQILTSWRDLRSNDARY
jgi:hypothetical protein